MFGSDVPIICLLHLMFFDDKIYLYLIFDKQNSYYICEQSSLSAKRICIEFIVFYRFNDDNNITILFVFK